jgi:hypothetical protein
MGLRKQAIAALLVLVMLGVMMPATAWIGGERLINIGDMVFGTEFVIQKPIATLFHSENLASADTEALAIAFPVDASGLTVSPSIAQTSAQTATASDTGFFKANWCYTAGLNPGNYELGPDISKWHPMKSPNMVGSGISWPYMNNAPASGGSTMQFKPAINTSPDTSGPSVKTPAFGANNGGLTGGNISTGGTVPKLVNGNANGKSATPNRDYKNMTRADVKNMTGLEKMYRNANMRNTVPQSHQGSVIQPTTIDTFKQPLDIIKPPNKPQVIKDSLNMTKDNTHLKTLFWDL